MKTNDSLWRLLRGRSQDIVTSVSCHSADFIVLLGSDTLNTSNDVSKQQVVISFISLLGAETCGF